MKNIQFIFDLDGTLTKVETLPFITEFFEKDLAERSVCDSSFTLQNSILTNKSMQELTRQCVEGEVSFEESFTKRVSMLAHLPVNIISDCVGHVPLFSTLISFINTHKDNCKIATGNVYPWIENLLNTFSCKVYASKARVENNQIAEVTEILQKERVVKKYQSKGAYVVFIGDGQNDFEAMKCADMGIACGLLHRPAKSLCEVATHSIFEEENLYHVLCELFDKA